MSLKDTVETFENQMWQLLLLERDITRLETQDRKSSQECQNHLKLYRQLSLKIFGNVRPDREE